MKFLTRSVHQSWAVVFLCAGIVVGAIVGLNFKIEFFGSPVWLWLVFLVVFLVYFIPKPIFLLLAFLAGAILMLFRITTELKGEGYIKKFYGQTILVSGKVDGDPETDDSGTSIKLKELKFGEQKIRASGRIYLSLRQNREIVRSDDIVLSGKLSEGFGTFAGYMYKPNVVSIARPDPGDLILKIRNWFAERIQKLISEPQVNLGLSYLLGMKSNLPDNLSESLRTVGLVHIVVASGAHLSILVEIARKIFGKISRFTGLFFSVLFVLMFMTMVGFTPSILRAGVMSILTLLAWYVGRNFAPWRIILIVAAFTLMLDPTFLGNLGWLLSFASFGGIMILGPKLTDFFFGDKKPNFVAEIIITTISATLMTLPIILYYYGAFSLISVVANLLILPTLSFAMGLVFLTGVISGIPGIETFVAFLATKLLDFHILVVEFFGQQRSFMVSIESGLWQVFLLYLLIAVPLLIGLLRKKMIKLRGYVRTQ